MRASILAVVLAAGCGGARPGAETLGTLSFDVPDGWKRTSDHLNGIDTALFAPTENTNKETLVVIRTERAVAVAGFAATYVPRFLADAQRTLPGAQVSSVTPVTTNGLSGFQIVVDFVPAGLAQHYHRVHAVFADGETLVHVMYTARQADADLAAFSTVLRSLREES